MDAPTDKIKTKLGSFWDYILKVYKRFKKKKKLGLVFGKFLSELVSIKSPHFIADFEK